jgi:hypothetical protein
MYLLVGGQRFEETGTHTLLDFLDARNNDITSLDTEASGFSRQNALKIHRPGYSVQTRCVTCAIRTQPESVAYFFESVLAAS